MRLRIIVTRTLETRENYNLLFVGPPASAKTLFLYEILELRKGEYIVRRRVLRRTANQL